jgi:hypothetical protein
MRRNERQSRVKNIYRWNCEEFPRGSQCRRMTVARAFESSFLAWNIEPLFAIRGRWEESCAVKLEVFGYSLSLCHNARNKRVAVRFDTFSAVKANKHLFEPRVSLFLLPIFVFPFFLPFRTHESHTPDCTAAEKLVEEIRDKLFIFPNIEPREARESRFTRF